MARQAKPDEKIPDANMRQGNRAQRAFRNLASGEGDLINPDRRGKACDRQGIRHKPLFGGFDCGAVIVDQSPPTGSRVRRRAATGDTVLF